MALYAPNPGPVLANHGADATAVLCATPCVVFSVYCANANAGNRWLQLWDQAAVPSPGDAVPATAPVFKVPAGGSIVIGADFFTAGGVRFTAKLIFAFSTTATTYTAGSASDQETSAVVQ